MIKKIILPIAVMALISCNYIENKKVDINNVAIDKDSTKSIQTEYTNIPQALDLNPLDSLLTALANDELVFISVQADSLKEYSSTISILNNTNLESITYNYPSSKRTNNISTIIPGKRVEYHFKNSESAKSAYDQLLNEITSNQLKGKIAIKSGAIVFQHKSTIHLIPVASCGSKERLNLVSKIIEDQIFSQLSDLKGTIIECGLKEVRKF